MSKSRWDQIQDKWDEIQAIWADIQRPEAQPAERRQCDEYQAKWENILGVASQSVDRSSCNKASPGPGLEEQCKLLIQRRLELDAEERDRLTKLVCDMDDAFDRLKAGLASLKGVGYLNQPR